MCDMVWTQFGCPEPDRSPSESRDHRVTDLGKLYVRKKEVPKLPVTAGIRFRSKIELAAELVRWLGSLLAGEARSRSGWGSTVAMPSGSFLGWRCRRASRWSPGSARMRRCTDLPPGQKRGRGRPPIYGKNRISLAKRAGQSEADKRKSQKTFCYPSLIGGIPRTARRFRSPSRRCGWTGTSRGKRRRSGLEPPRSPRPDASPVCPTAS